MRKQLSIAKYIAGRLAQFLLVLLAASILVFLMCHLSDIDPISTVLGGKKASPETVSALREKFHLDESLPRQYLIWAGGMLCGDFGIDFKYQQPVGDLIAGRLPVTLLLTLFGSVLALVIALPLGIFAGIHRHRLGDRLASLFSLILMACPPFFISVIAIFIISRAAPSISFTGGFSGFWQAVGRLWLPSLCLALGMIALAQRMVRSSMIEELSSPHVQFSRANGLPEGKIVRKYAFKNALIPLITVYGIQVGSMLVGSVLVETVFSLAGLGGLLISAVQTGNYPITQAITMLMVFVFLLISTATDILYTLIDPRIRRERSGDNE